MVANQSMILLVVVSIIFQFVNSFHIFQQSYSFPNTLRRINEVGKQRIIWKSLQMGNALEVPDVPRHIDFATEDSSSSKKNENEEEDDGGGDEDLSIIVPKLTPVEEFFQKFNSLSSQQSPSTTTSSSNNNKKLAKNIDPLQRLRNLGIETLRKAEVPYPKSEAWRFTNIKRLFDPTLLSSEPPLSSSFTSVSLENIYPEWKPNEVQRIKSFLSHYIDKTCNESYIVILNGRVEPTLSNFVKIPEKIQIESYLKGHLSGKLPAKPIKKELFTNLFETIPDTNVHQFKSYGSNSLTGLNLIKLQDYLYINVPRACREKVPIQILTVNYDRKLPTSSHLPSSPALPSDSSSSSSSAAPSLPSPTTEYRERLSFPRIAIYVGNSSTLQLKQSLLSLPDDLLENDIYESLLSQEIYRITITQKDNRYHPPAPSDGKENNSNHLKNVFSRLTTCNTAVKDDNLNYSFVGGFTRIYTEGRSKIQHIYLQELAQNVRGFDVLSVDCGNDSRYEFHPVEMGSDMHRLNYHQVLREPGANTTFSGVTLADVAQALDIHSSILHNNSYTTCDQNQRMLLGEKAYAVFKGILIIPQIAKKADGSQIMKAFMLGNESRVHCMPFLDLKCSDIKCAHGAAVGDLDPNDLYYLASRGIGPELARPLLTKSFVFEVIKPVLQDAQFAQRLAYKMTRLSSDIENLNVFESSGILSDTQQIQDLFAKAKKSSRSASPAKKVKVPAKKALSATVAK